MHVFGRRGFADTTVLDIAEKAGLASGTVYQYFEDKSDIFRRLLQDLTDRLHRETRLPTGDDGRLIVREAMLRYLDVYRENASVFRAWWELLEPPTEFTAAWVSVHDRSRREIGKVIREGQDRGTISSDVDPDITAELIVAAFERPVYSRMVLEWEQEYSDEQLVGLMSHLLGSERLG